MDPLLDVLLARRSASSLAAPGPNAQQLECLLRVATTVPDHGKLLPFRFAIVEGDGRHAFGRALADTAREHSPTLSDARLDGIRAKAFRSPTSIVLIASPRPGKIEIWEQHATAACAGYAIVLAAHAIGIGAVWKSVPFTRGKALAELFGLHDDEQTFGWIHLGTATTEESPRSTIDLSSIAIVIDGEGTRRYHDWSSENSQR